MGQCFLYGTGGGGSGVRVVIQAEAPTNPRENTVWVKSDIAGKKYVFAEAEPEAAEEGLLWLSVTGKGIITAARVYSGGKWVLVDAYMFIGGQWVPIASSWNGELFENGNQYEDLTGGWTSADGNYLIGTFSDDFYRCRMVNKLDVTNYNTIKFTIVSNTFWSSTWGISNSKAGGEDDFVAKTNVGDGSAGINHSGTYAVDVSSVSGEYYLRFMSWNGNFSVSKVWLE